MALRRRRYGRPRRRRVTFRKRRFGRSRRRFPSRRRFKRFRPNRPELKAYTEPWGTINPTYNTTFNYSSITDAILPGTSSTTRIGSTIVVRKVQLLFNIAPAAATPIQSEFVRLVVGRTANNVTAPTAFSGIFDYQLLGSSPQAAAEFGLWRPGEKNYRPVYNKRFRVIASGSTAATPSTIHLARRVTLRWRRGLRIQYNDVGAAIDNMRPNTLWFSVIGQQGANSPSGGFAYRIWYTDV